MEQCPDLLVVLEGHFVFCCKELIDKLPVNGPELIVLGINQQILVQIPFCLASPLDQLIPAQKGIRYR